MAENNANQINPDSMNQQQALNVLVQAARIAQAKGAYTLEDAELVAKAIKVFIPTQDPNAVINKDAEPSAEEAPKAEAPTK
tara:strand:- start:920 stop:1162 length:243 start_codon:yes stop_codon:yes gene_type:complete